MFPLHPLLLLSLVPTGGDIERADLAQVVEPLLASEAIPGTVVALTSPDGTTRIEAFGLADVAGAEAMAPGTLFQVGSVTKPLTATLIALLVQEGVLAFDAPLGSCFEPGVVPEALAAITLEELMTHSSGLPREASNRVDLPHTPSVMQPMSTAELLAGLAHTRLEREPGEAWGYSNLGYALLSAVAAEAGGAPYHEQLTQRVLTPLGMLHSGIFVGDTPPGLASCYWPEDEELTSREPWRFGTACAFSGLVSDAGDLARFLAAQMERGEGALLAPETLAYLHGPRVNLDGAGGRAMAPGWFIDPMPGGLVVVGHGGEVDGHSAVIACIPAVQVALVVLCNKGGRSAEVVARALMAAVLPRMLR